MPFLVLPSLRERIDTHLQTHDRELQLDHVLILGFGLRHAWVDPFLRRAIPRTHRCA